MKNFEDFLKNTKSNTKQLMEILKLKKILKKTEEECDQLIYDLGCEIYDEHINKFRDTESTNGLKELIGEKRAYIKSLRNELNVLNGRIECDTCGKLSSYYYDYCPFCGCKLSRSIVENNDLYKEPIVISPEE